MEWNACNNGKAKINGENIVGIRGSETILVTSIERTLISSTIFDIASERHIFTELQI
jgi:hypothetical protein